MKVKKTVALLWMIAVLIGLYSLSAYGEEWEASAYDGRTSGVITPVRDQGNTNLCWAYAASAAAEASLIRSGVDKTESAKRNFLSPTQIGYARQNRGSDPLKNTSGVQSAEDYRQSQGSAYYAASLFSQWCGPVGDRLSDDCNGWENAKYRLTASPYMNLPDLKTNEKSRTKIKKAIVRYGAVTFSYNNASERYYYNPLNETGTTASSHACVIIGWDDRIAASDFMPGGATQDGGWLVKNSYSSLPYFYLSYDNTSSHVYAFAFVPKDQYDHNYFYDMDVSDFGLGSLIKPKGAANVFKAKMGETTKEECVTAVQVGVDGGPAKVHVKVYTNLRDASDPTSGTLAATGELDAPYPGYYTVDLPRAAVVDKGSDFSVVAEVAEDSDAYFKLTQNTGQSWLRRGSTWNRATGTPRLKAYTKMVEQRIELSDTKVILHAEPDTNERLILAYYDNDCLKDVRVYTVSDSQNGQFEIPKGWKKKEGCRWKAMLWQFGDDMIPICAKETTWE